ncbi:AbrB/MazE/SpoVT family DNA-binding domain-containing protein [Patescibacteria group bacterium]|nr:AbrB/MazE/SpoVT family DNA-binding domain-containing protein [Patescibacteria group bacterium]
MKIVTISSKNQITIPKDMLLALDLKAKSKAIVEKKDGVLTFTPIKGSVVEETAGSLRKYVHPSKLGKSVAEIEDAVGKIIAKHATSD